jgi:hypothetical protein
MSSRLLPEEFVMRRDIRDHDRAIELANRRKHHWMLAIVVLAAILGLGVLLTSVLRAYGESHYDYLTSAPTLSSQAGLS